MKIKIKKNLLHVYKSQVYIIRLIEMTPES